jgi:hypothetical protein
MKKKNVSLLIGCVFSVAGFYFALKNVPLNELFRYLVSINWIWGIPTILLGILTYILRAIRWQLILSTSTRVSFFSSFHPLMISMMINNIVPGRAGEFVRPAILKKMDGVPYSLGLATVVAERFFDAITLIFIFGGILQFIHLSPDLNITFHQYQLNRETLEAVFSGLMKICFVFIIGIVFISIPKIQKSITAMVWHAPSILPVLSISTKVKIKEICCAPIVRIVENIAKGFSLVKIPSKIGGCLAYSLIIWLLQAVSLYVFSFGCPDISLSYTEMTTVFIIICIFIALPSVPGFWGLWEAGGVFGMALFGIPAAQAAGFILATHSISTLVAMTIGSISAVSVGFNITNIKKDSSIYRP